MSERWIPAFAVEIVLPPDPGPGVYFLVRNGELVYIGQSLFPIRRIATHQDQRKFDRVLFLSVPKRALNAVEGAFIRWLRPPENGTRGKRGAYIIAGGNPAEDAIVLKKYGVGPLLERDLEKGAA